MGHGKETPRQKMIGMMYLVLTALLALNVSKDVLNAFLIVNTGLQATNKSFESKSDFLYSEIDKQVLINETKTMPVKEAAERVKHWSDELYEHVQELKVELIMIADKIDEKEAADTLAVKLKHVKSSDNYDVPTHEMLGGDVREIEHCKARELKNKLIEYRANLIGEIAKDEIKLIDKTSVIEQLGDLGIDTEDNKDAKDDKPEEKHWEYKKFYHAPMFAAVTILTQIQSEILNAEAVTLEKLYSSISASDFKFNTLKAIVIPNTDLVIKGNNYEAKVFLAAYDTTQPPDILVGNFEEVDGKIVMKGNYRTLDVDEENRGNYSNKETSTGDKVFKGVIQLTAPTGEVRKFPFEKTYTVAEPNLVVSPLKMKVFYLAIENPVGISMPGVENISATINNGKMSKKGNDWIVVPSKAGTAKVTVYAEVDGTKRTMGTVDFRVKRVPDPVAMIGGKSGGNIDRSLLSALDGVYAVMPEWFDFELKYKVTGFTVSFTDKAGFVKEARSKSSKFTTDQKNMLKALGKGKKVYFEDITAVGPDGGTRKLGTISLKTR
ncbi:gliding motility protein GldM [Bacteroidota bacterium]